MQPIYTQYNITTESERVSIEVITNEQRELSPFFTSKQTFNYVHKIFQKISLHLEPANAWH